jgi:hypothetical protein
MKRRLARIVVVTLAIASVAIVAEAQTRPDLNGTWRINPAQSKFFGARGAPRDLVIRLEQRGLTLRETVTVVNFNGRSTVSLNYRLDGREIVNRVDAEEIRSTARWNGDRLVIEWNDKGGTFTRIFAFSGNSRTITINTRDSNPDGETDDLVVLERP